MGGMADKKSLTNIATTKIILQELRLSCLIGIDAAERHVRQQLVLDVEICVNQLPDSDDAPVLNYYEVIKRLRDFAATADCGLMETFAEQAASLLLVYDSVLSVRVYCRKPMPFADIAAAGVEICRS